jgi:two-component system nitrate/nitrite response regulator NarL
VIDDAAAYRKFVGYAVERHGLGQIVGEGRDGFEGLRLIQRTSPDVAVIDVHMPGMGGLELIQTLRMRSHISTRLVAFSTSSLGCREALRVGADAAVVKQTDPTELLRALVARPAGSELMTKVPEA